jgi:hypothetical protein
MIYPISMAEAKTVVLSDINEGLIQARLKEEIADERLPRNRELLRRPDRFR